MPGNIFILGGRMYLADPYLIHLSADERQRGMIRFKTGNGSSDAQTTGPVGRFLIVCLRNFVAGADPPDNSMI